MDTQIFQIKIIKKNSYFEVKFECDVSLFNCILNKKPRHERYIGPSFYLFQPKRACAHWTVFTLKCTNTLNHYDTATRWFEHPKLFKIVLEIAIALAYRVWQTYWYSFQYKKKFNLNANKIKTRLVFWSIVSCVSFFDALLS